jgi:hypothetical protein
MSLPPSFIRSRWLADICEKNNLSDPFRAINYDKKDFTYVPRDGGKNRSRIDFFLISDFLLSISNKCYISPSVNTLLFDHKSIFLSFDVSKTRPNHYINPTIFKHPRFEAVVATAVVETYLQHADVHQEDVDIDQGLLHVGRLIEKITQCNNIEFNIYFDNTGTDYATEYDRASNELHYLVDTLPDPERLNEISVTCDPDIFLEVLMGNIRNALLSFQAWLQKTKNARANCLISSLNLLKKDYVLNAEEMLRLERDLQKLGMRICLQKFTA